MSSQGSHIMKPKSDKPIPPSIITPQDGSPSTSQNHNIQTPKHCNKAESKNAGLKQQKHSILPQQLSTRNGEKEKSKGYNSNTSGKFCTPDRKTRTTGMNHPLGEMNNSGDGNFPQHKEQQGNRHNGMGGVPIHSAGYPSNQRGSSRSGVPYGSGGDYNTNHYGNQHNGKQQPQGFKGGPYHPFHPPHYPLSYHNPSQNVGPPPPAHYRGSNVLQSHIKQISRDPQTPTRQPGAAFTPPRSAERKKRIPPGNANPSSYFPHNYRQQNQDSNRSSNHVPPSPDGFPQRHLGPNYNHHPSDMSSSAPNFYAKNDRSDDRNYASSRDNCYPPLPHHQQQHPFPYGNNGHFTNQPHHNHALPHPGSSSSFPPYDERVALHYDKQREYPPHGHHAHPYNSAGRSRDFYQQPPPVYPQQSKYRPFAQETAIARKVSSSFAESIKSKNSEHPVPLCPPSARRRSRVAQYDDYRKSSHASPTPSDSSWKAGLNRVDSIIKDRGGSIGSHDSTVSHSSQGKETSPPPQIEATLTNLDSFSTVASMQDPIETSESKEEEKEKKDHNRSMSDSSLYYERNKEGREDGDTERELSGSRNSPDERKRDREDYRERRERKRQRDGKRDQHSPMKYKDSPLNLNENQPDSPGILNMQISQRSASDHNRKQLAHRGPKKPKAQYLHQSERENKVARSNSFASANRPPAVHQFDKAHSFSYYNDSVPPAARSAQVSGGQQRPSSRSSSITAAGPPHLPNNGSQQIVNSMSSWDIHGQDSFNSVGMNSGSGTVNNANPGGIGNLSSFSFSNDYALFHGNNSYANLPQHAQHNNTHLAFESRNQSFDHQLQLSNSCSIDEVNPPPQLNTDYHHPTPPEHPSHNTNIPPVPYHPAVQRPISPQYHKHPPSYYHHYHLHPQRQYSSDTRSPPPPSFSYSEDHHLPNAFQPPPHDFHPHHHGKPPPTVYIVNAREQAQPIKGGVYNWSKEDDARLTEIMKKYRNPRDWDPIAKEHGRGKSPKECHERWIRYLKPGVRKGQWQDHEDAIVVEAVTTSSEQPFTRWSDLAQRLPGRVGKQIRDRWVNHLNPAINHMPFTREDDLLLFKGHEELGKRWVEISTKYFNSTRSENHIKNRWYSASFKKFIANEYGPDAYSGSGSKEKKELEKQKGEKKLEEKMEEKKGKGKIEELTAGKE